MIKEFCDLTGEEITGDVRFTIRVEREDEIGHTNPAMPPLVLSAATWLKVKDAIFEFQK